MTSTSLVLWIAMARLTLCLTELHLLILLPLLRRPHNIATPSICATLFSTKNAAKVTIRMKEDLSILLSVWGSCFFSLFKLVHVELTKRYLWLWPWFFPLLSALYSCDILKMFFCWWGPAAPIRVHCVCSCFRTEFGNWMMFILDRKGVFIPNSRRYTVCWDKHIHDYRRSS